MDEPRAKVTVLMVICKDDGNLSATEVRSKTDEYGVEMVIRFLSTYESVEIKTDGEPSIVEVARRVQARRDKITTLAQTSVGGHQEIGAVERANGTVQAQLRAYFLDVQNRMQVRIIPGTLLFPWILRIREGQTRHVLNVWAGISKAAPCTVSCIAGNPKRLRSLCRRTAIGRRARTPDGRKVGALFSSAFIRFRIGVGSKRKWHFHQAKLNCTAAYMELKSVA